MAAGIVASSVLAFEDFELDAPRSLVLLTMTFLLGFVMVSNFRYRNFKDLDFRHRLPFRYLVIGVFIFAMVAIEPKRTLFIVFLTYATLGAVFGIWRLRIHRPRFGKPYSQDPDEDLHEEIDENDSHS
jgi:CDP-diacylglycerol--serine O-phosphatidyltransferase